MKNKRTAKSHNRYNGYNVYGEPCEVRTIKLKNETALEQCLLRPKEDGSNIPSTGLAWIVKW